jgi:D-alanyl-D-alanine carboxypeptidase (penicillin-binding protein 5/6)
MGKKRKRKLNYFRVVVAAVLILLIFIGFSFIISSCSDHSDDKPVSKAVSSLSSEDEEIPVTTAEPTTEEPTTEPLPSVSYPTLTPDSAEFSEDITPLHGILIDTDSNEIVAYRDYDTVMYPASLTKIMTLIVTVENTDDLSETVTITPDMVDPMVEAEASRAGFVAGETPTVEEVLYGLILPSGGDAALAAAIHTAGSEEAFVELMNRKAEELGLKNTHFTNPVGLHDVNHYSTAEDIALILEYALQNEECKKILSTYQYQIEPTEYNPEGLLLTSTVFSRMEGTEMPGVVIKGGKTGYTDEAGNCLATYAEANSKTYVLVYTGATSQWNIVYDTLSAYSIFCVGGDAYDPPQ